MNLIAYPGETLHGTLSLPGDKSLSHRTALFAAMADGESRVENFLVSGVTQVMLDALTGLGVHWQLRDNCLLVNSRGIGSWHPPENLIYCGNSATTLRLLAGALAAAGIPAVLDGSEGLRRRPMQRIVDPLKQMGVSIESSQGCAPIELGRSRMPLKPIDYTLPVASGQIKSCLLLAGLAASGPSMLREPGPSRDHTERMLNSLGIAVTSAHYPADENTPEIYTTRLIPPQSLNLPAFQLSLPGDISAAAFLIVAALVTPGSQITLRKIGLNPTRSGILDALQSMGAGIQILSGEDEGGEPAGDICVRSSELHGTEVTGTLVVRMIDEFPIFAVAAAYAQGRTIVRDAEDLRHKESDRISAMCAELRSLGVQVEETLDGFVIEGRGKISGGVVDPHGDHRLAMSLVVAGLAASEPVMIRGAQIITESFPTFQAELESLGAQLKSEES